MRFSKTAWLFVFLVTTPALADSHFDVSTLSIDGDTLAVAPADLDGDGHKDLVVAMKRGRAPDEQRYFAIFWNLGGHDSLRPDATIPVDKDISAFDAAPIDDHAAAQIVLVGREGVSAIAFRNRRAVAPVKLTNETTLFWKSDHGALPHINMVHDLTGKNSRELLVPGPGQLLVYPRTGARFGAPVRLEVEMKSELGSGEAMRERESARVGGFSISYVFPSLQIADSDGDGRVDILATIEDRLWVYRQRGPLVFDAHASLHRDFALRSPAELKEAFSSVSIVVRDLDGDGIADLLLHKQVSHGISSARTVNAIYLGQRGGGYAKEPDQTMKGDGVSGFDVLLADVTGDGHPDLVVPSVTIGVWQIIRILTTKTLKANLQIFAFGPDRRFSTKPVAERELKFKISFSGNNGFQAVDVHGDYNGDHRADLAFGTGEDELSIFPGVNADGLIAKDASDVVVVDSRGELMPVDLDGEGKDDLVLVYPSNAAHRNEIVVMMNRGGW